MTVKHFAPHGFFAILTAVGFTWMAHAVMKLAAMGLPLLA